MKESKTTPVRLSAVGSLPELLFEEVHQRISQRAYELFLNRGGAEVDAMDDWLTAERELISRLPVTVNLSVQYIAIEVVLPHENLPGLTVYFDENRLVLAADRDPDGKQVLQPFHLPSRISMDGVDVDQSGCTLRITAAIASSQSGIQL